MTYCSLKPDSVQLGLFSTTHFPLTHSPVLLPKPIRCPGFRRNSMNGRSPPGTEVRVKSYPKHMSSSVQHPAEQRVEFCQHFTLTRETLNIIYFLSYMYIMSFDCCPRKPWSSEDHPINPPPQCDGSV